MANRRTSPQPIIEGGTGAQTLTGVIIGHGTSALTGNAVTQHDVLVGGASNAITSVAPSATSGVALVSGGAAADPLFGTVVVAGGGTGQTSFTANAPIIAGGTSTAALAQVTTGLNTAGYVLTANSSGAPTFQVASSGAMVLIQTKTANASATLNFTTGITSTYTNYFVIVSNLIPASGTPNLCIDISIDGGATYITTGYQAGYLIGLYNNAISSPYTASSTAHLLFSPTAAPSTTGLSLEAHIYGLTNGSFPMITGTVATGTGGGMYFGDFGGSYTSTATVNALSFYFPSINMTSGTISLYGIAK